MTKKVEDWTLADITYQTMFAGMCVIAIVKLLQDSSDHEPPEPV
jgi:hypothetical protein